MQLRKNFSIGQVKVINDKCEEKLMKLTIKESLLQLSHKIFERITGVVMIVILIMLGMRAHLFFAPENLMIVLKQSGILSLIAVGLTVVLVSGGFDMGAGALVQFSSNIAAGLIIAGINPMLTLPIGLFIGLIIGALNVFFVVVLKISSFVATLGSMFILMGLTSMYNNGKALITQEIPGFTFLGQGSIGPIPIIYLIVIVFGVLLHIFLKNTKTGLRMYATGENSDAAKLRGIDVTKYTVIGYLLSGMILGLTGVFQCSYSYGASAVPSGLDFLIKALSAAYLGSTFSRTGELSIIGTIFSATFISALSNALIMNEVSNQQIAGILGGILILSIMLTVIKKREIGQVTIF
jgi:ribose/xylose/arabinose/galactoside ABC-type transport system permease subunit